MDAPQIADRVGPVAAAVIVVAEQSSVTAEPESPELHTQAVLLAIWQALFLSTEIGVQDNFFVIGGYSLLAGRMVARVREEFGFDLSPHQLFETPTIAGLAAFINSQLAAEPHSKRHSAALVPLQPRGSRAPFFCLHSAVGTVFTYQPLAALLGEDQPVYGVEARGVADDAAPLDTMPALVEHCITQMRTLQPHGPYYLGGHSFAGLLALEVARELQARGERVALLALLDTWVLQHPTLPRWVSDVRRWVGWRSFRFKIRLRRLLRPVSKLQSLPAEERLEYLREKVPTNIIGKRNVPAAPASDQVAAVARLNRVQRALGRPMRSYRVAPYAGRITYFQAIVPHSAVWFNQRKAWALIARGGLEVHQVPGAHSAMLDEPQVQVLGRLLGACLQRAQTAGQN